MLTPPLVVPRTSALHFDPPRAPDVRLPGALLAAPTGPRRDVLDGRKSQAF